MRRGALGNVTSLELWVDGNLLFKEVSRPPWYKLLALWRWWRGPRFTCNPSVKAWLWAVHIEMSIVLLWVGKPLPAYLAMFSSVRAFRDWAAVDYELRFMPNVVEVVTEKSLPYVWAYAWDNNPRRYRRKHGHRP